MEIENINLNNKLVPDKEVLRVERAIQNMLNCDDLVKEQREKLREYNQYLMGRKKLTRTRRNYLNAVKNLGTFLKKPFEDATKKDLQEYLGKLKVSDNTFWFWQFIIKIFYQWLYNLERKQYPEAVSWIKVEKPSKQKIPLFLVEEQVKKLIEIADCVRDKCILSILMDSGCRVGEIVALNIEDIKFDKENPVAYFEVKNVEGCKTGSRNLPIPLVNSVPILRELINTHPLRNQKDAPLFISYRSGEYGSRLLTSGIRQIIKKYARRLGLPSSVACHTFRHSHFRHLREQGFSMLDMKELGGWKRWDTVERYCTLADSKKITEKMLELNGIKKFT